MTDWQKGDLALCVDTGRKGFWHATYVKKGCVYTVLRAFVDGDGDHVLSLGGVHYAYLSLRFRKVTPPKADKFDREVIDLMAGKKVPA